MKKRPKWFQMILLFLFLWFFFFFSLPFYLEVPGTVFPLKDMIEVDHQFQEDSSDFYITTVGIEQATPVKMIRSFLPYQDLVSESELLGEFDDYESYNAVQKYYMNHSINNAIKVAFDTAGKDYELKYQGIYVLQVTEKSDFAEKLKVGDIVESVDEEKFESSIKFIDYIGNKNIGEEIKLRVRRDDEELVFVGDLIELESGDTGIGIGLTDKSEIRTDPVVEIDAAKIGGPSAGLMFSLEIYRQLVDINIKDDYNIAGTGTIALDGSVGRIGGIEKKIVAADKEGVDYFLAPNDELPDGYKKLHPEKKSNYKKALETAEKLNSEVQIVPVKSLDDAIEFLENLSSKKNTVENEKVISLYVSKDLIAGSV